MALEEALLLLLPAPNKHQKSVLCLLITTRNTGKGNRQQVTEKQNKHCGKGSGPKALIAGTRNMLSQAVQKRLRLQFALSCILIVSMAVWANFS